MPKETVTRSYLANVIHNELGYSRAESADLIDSVLSEVGNSLVEDGEVKITSFGTFKVLQKSPRVGRNPKTKEEVAISARNTVSFYVSNIVKDLVNGKDPKNSEKK